MKVTLLNKDAFADMAHNAVHAALTCTGNEHKLTETNIKSFLCKIIEKGHDSILEHINLTFRIDGVSRALLQELARHHHISMSVQSTRSTIKKILTSPDKVQRLLGELSEILLLASDVLPETVKKTERNLYNARRLYAALEHSTGVFHELAQMDGGADALVPDYIKYLIPECMPTSLIMTANVRALRNIFFLRSQPAALLEFRRLVAHLYKAIPEGWDILFANVLHSAVSENLEKLTAIPEIATDMCDEDEE